MGLFTDLIEAHHQRELDNFQRDMGTWKTMLTLPGLTEDQRNAIVYNMEQVAAGPLKLDKKSRSNVQPGQMPKSRHELGTFGRILAGIAGAGAGVAKQLNPYPSDPWKSPARMADEGVGPDEAQPGQLVRMPKAWPGQAEYETQHKERDEALGKAATADEIAEKDRTRKLDALKQLRDTNMITEERYNRDVAEIQTGVKETQFPYGKGSDVFVQRKGDPNPTPTKMIPDENGVPRIVNPWGPGYLDANTPDLKITYNKPVEPRMSAAERSGIDSWKFLGFSDQPGPDGSASEAQQMWAWSQRTHSDLGNKLTLARIQGLNMTVATERALSGISPGIMKTDPPPFLSPGKRNPLARPQPATNVTSSVSYDTGGSGTPEAAAPPWAAAPPGPLAPRVQPQPQGATAKIRNVRDAKAAQQQGAAAQPAPAAATGSAAAPAKPFMGPPAKPFVGPPTSAMGPQKATGTPPAAPAQPTAQPKLMLPSGKPARTQEELKAFLHTHPQADMYYGSLTGSLPTTGMRSQYQAAGLLAGKRELEEFLGLDDQELAVERNRRTESGKLLDFDLGRDNAYESAATNLLMFGDVFKQAKARMDHEHKTPADQKAWLTKIMVNIRNGVIGDKDTTEMFMAAQAFAGAYGKTIAGGQMSQAQVNVSAQDRAADIISAYLTTGSVDGAVAQARREMKTEKDALNHMIKLRQDEMLQPLGAFVHPDWFGMKANRNPFDVKLPQATTANQKLTPDEIRTFLDAFDGDADRAAGAAFEAGYDIRGRGSKKK